MIVHVVAGGGLYGLERVLLNLLPALRGRGVDVGALCLVPRGSPLAEVGEAIEATGVPTLYATGSPAGARVLSALRAQHTTALHTHGYKATILGGVLAARLGRPLLATCHAEAMAAVRNTPGPASLKLRLYIGVESAVLRRARAVAAVSAGIRNELLGRGVRPARIEILPNGVRIAAGAGGGQRRFTPQLVIVGRLVPGKNVHTAIEAVARLRPRFPGVGLVVAGTGSLGEELAAFAARNGVEDAVHFAGFVTDVGALLDRSDCLVMPSSTEGMPLTILEAMAARTPIVAARVGAIPEVVRDRAEARLVPPADATALADTIGQVLADPASARAMSEAAHQRFATEYTDTAMAARYQAWYDRHLGT